MREKLIGDRRFYRRLFAIAVPMMIQMAITNFASMLDNVMVGQMGTEQMTGVAIANQLVFVYNLFIFGAVSGPGIYTCLLYTSISIRNRRKTGWVYWKHWDLFFTCIRTQIIC